jgi:uncharacterized protein
MKNNFALLRRAAVLLALFAFIFHNFSYAQQDNGSSSLLWKVSGKGLKKPSYLYGTYHLVPSGYLPAAGKVMQAFQASSGVIVEIEMDSTSMQKAAMMAYMPSHKLSALISDADYGLLAEELKAQSGYDLQMFEQVQPITLSLMLGMSYSQNAAPWLKEYAGEPLDAFFANEGRKLGKNILALESVEEQMQLLYQTDSPEKQATELVKMVREKDRMQRGSADVVNSWQRENLDAMAAVSATMIEEFGGQEAMLTNRNARWMEVLPKQFKKGSQFVAVGALHLTGDDGLIHLLRAKGYTVEAVTGK